MPNINPATGLSTDYLNHFSEALMALEMVRDMPECIEDLRAWTPKTYAEHFAGSRLSNRDAIIRMYQVRRAGIAADARRAVGRAQREACGSARQRRAPCGDRRAGFRAASMPPSISGR